MKGDDFNMLLEHAKHVFPGLPMVQRMKPVEDGTSMGDLMFKLSVLDGATKADVHGAAHGRDGERGTKKRAR